mgnify:CR=1 FL=1
MDLVDFFEKFIKIVTRYWDVFLIKGLSTTLALSAIAVFFGAIIGTLLAFGKMGKSRILRGIITAYVEIIRGTPSLLQVYVGYFVVPLLLPSLNVSTYASVAIALTINSSAYVSEVIRSGIQAVDKGQTEAARSLGLTRSQAMIKSSLRSKRLNSGCTGQAERITQRDIKLILLSSSIPGSPVRGAPGRAPVGGRNGREVFKLWAAASL